ncbi:MAG TPA: Ku protein [Anaeromyxobacteraceae bacterium]|nr:Ku protein [Anaeromyxobacteraceae bacterium]
MALRAMATATISFGLVSIPVRLFAATQASAGLGFNLLHKKCGTRLKQQYVCPRDGEKVEREDMVKGYEFAKDQYVTFTPEELKALEEASSQTIEIAEFVPLSEVDPVYFERPYYLGPDRGGAKAYRLLGEAMRRSGKAALARYAARGKQYLVLLRPLGSRLVMQQLLHSDEVRPISEVDLEEAELKEPEVQLALRLVEQTASPAFHPENYPDEVRARTQALIEQKVQGQEIQVSAPEAPRAQVIDLLEALKQSLAAAPEGKVQPAAAAEAGAPAPASERRPAKRAPREATARSRATTKKQG